MPAADNQTEPSSPVVVSLTWPAGYHLAPPTHSHHASALRSDNRHWQHCDALLAWCHLLHELQGALHPVQLSQLSTKCGTTHHHPYVVSHLSSGTRGHPTPPASCAPPQQCYPLQLLFICLSRRFSYVYSMLLTAKIISLTGCVGEAPLGERCLYAQIGAKTDSTASWVPH